MNSQEELPQNIGQGELARLIPIGAETNKERRATSTLLATLMAVPEYAQHMLSIAGCKANSRSKIKCYTEVVFKDKNNKPVEMKDSDRPDGLITVKNGKTTWSALIEAKIGNAELDCSQIERYLDLAKAHKIDAVITISNQYANIPTHHPVNVNGQKTRTVSLYHWSWKSLLTEAVLHTDDNEDHKDVSDSSQHFILSEFKRFLQHDSTGINTITQMNKSWAVICSEGGLEKKTNDTINAMASWHNLCREITLEMSEQIGLNVIQTLPRKYNNEKNGYTSKLKDDVAALYTDGCVTCAFSIKDAASTLCLLSNIKEKYITTSMTIRAPKDSKTARGAIGWLIKQLSGIELPDVHVTACYAGRNSNRTCSLQELQENGYEAINDNNKNIPHSFEIYTKKNIRLSEIKGVRKFVEITKKSVFDYYQYVGQNLKNPQNKPPKMNRDNQEEEIQAIPAIVEADSGEVRVDAG